MSEEKRPLLQPEKLSQEAREAALVEALKVALDLYETLADDGDPGANQRKGAAFALRDLMKFAEPVTGKELLKPAWELLGALADIEAGRTHSIIEQPIRPQNRPGLNSQVRMHRITAVVAIEVLKSSGMTLKEASDVVSPHLRLEEISPAQLLGYRKRLKTSPGIPQEHLESYKRLSTEIRAHLEETKTDPREVVESILDQLARK